MTEPDFITLENESHLPTLELWCGK